MNAIMLTSVIYIAKERWECSEKVELLLGYHEILSNHNNRRPTNIKLEVNPISGGGHLE